MPLANSAKTGALLVATGLTAAGLNLGVMGIGGDESTSTDPVEVAAAEPNDSVELIAQAPAAQPVLLATVAEETPAGAGAAQPALATSGGTQAVAGGAAQADDDDSEDHESESEREPKPEQDSTTTDSPSVPTTSGTPAPTITPATPANPVTTTAPRTEYLTYEFSGVATVIVALHGGEELEFWSATPAPGWVLRVDDNTATRVKIKFRPLDGGDEAEWELNLRGGELKLKQEH